MLTIELNSYNVENCIEVLLHKYIANNPQYSYKGLAKEFGVAERTIYRWLKKYLIAPKNRKFEDKAIGYLLSKGFKISKDDSNN